MKKNFDEQLIEIYWKKNLGEQLSPEEVELLRKHSKEEDWEIVMEKFRQYCSFENEKEEAIANLEAAFEARFNRPMSKPVVGKVRRIRGTVWLKVAVVLIIIGGALLLLSKLNRDEEKQISVVLLPLNQVQLPDANAVLVLGDQSKVVFNPRKKEGILAKEQNVTVSIHEGHLKYTTDGGKKAKADLYHTILVASGEQLQLLLTDSSEVVLNARTALRFPVNFAQKNRIVELAGEGFFQVSANKNWPFIVKSDTVTTQVAGTSFGIHAYPGEGHQDITLFNGKIFIWRGIQKAKVDTAQIVRVTKDRMKIYTKDKTSIEKVASRKLGLFSYSDEYLSTIMQDVGRWYGLTIVNPKDLDMPYHFNLISIKRSEPVQVILKALEKSEKVRFKLTGKSLTVEPLR